jgi:hypothetical protein
MPPEAMQHPGAGKVGHVIQFDDASRARWRVSERDCRKDPGARKEWCLLFTSNNAIRRVWEYPPDWHLLSPAALALLSWER